MKKQSAAWNVAATHYLTAGFVPGILVGVAFMIISKFLQLPEMFASYISFGLLPAIASLLGVLYSAGYVHKKYFIPNGMKVVTLSSVYYAVLHLGFGGVLAYVALTTTANPNLVAVVVVIVGAIAGLIVFYAMSRKLLTSDPIAAESIAFGVPGNVPTAFEQPPSSNPTV